MPTDPKWREAQLQAMLALGDSPQDAERVLAAMERLSPDDPTVLPDSEAFAAMFGQVTPDDVRDATADWMVRARPEWKRLLTAQVKETASEFNPHHDALGRFAAGSAAVGLSYHALGRIGTQGRANVTSVRDALEKLQSVKTPDSDWSYPVRQGDKLRGHLIGTDGVVKTVVGAWYKPDKLPPALAEMNPWHDALGRFATSGSAMAADTGGGGGAGAASLSITDEEKEAYDQIVSRQGKTLNVTPGQAESLTQYRTSAYVDVNSRLRGGEALTPDQEKVTSDLDSMFSMVDPLSEPMVVYRGIFQTSSAPISWQKGEIVQDEGFVSTSADPDVAAGHVRPHGKAAVLCRIKVYKQARVVAVDAITKGLAESEILLPRKADFYIRGTRTDPQGRQWIDMDFVGVNGEAHA